MPWRDVADQAVCSQFRELDDIDANKAAVHDGGTTTVQPSALVKQVDAKTSRTAGTAKASPPDSKETGRERGPRMGR